VVDAPCYQPNVDLNERVADLTEIERETLRAFLRSSDPKALARQFGISEHTVKQRLGRARAKLGVGRTLDAAHLLARADGDSIYPSMVYTDLAHGDGARSAATDLSSDAVPSWSLLPSRDRPWNTQPGWVRLALIVAGMLAITITAVLAVDIMDTWSRLSGR
jgi:DNA-binding CsgD family transcriptional regulator